ncbi:thioredoxin F-type, chloroplastic isoform X2 [Corylus avellana]|uniref:thioredoxin F-type, chloroplastic isoform X2 n=1 Tax=Corylus avellana TaxID=13451 RepID=UPI001E221F85|nr:thioredoxin F-type, chloroplastic isoform X2 [Corylus avellana]
MALNLSLCPPSIRSPQTLMCSAKHPIALSSSSSAPYSKSTVSSSRRSLGEKRSRGAYGATVVRSSLDTVGPTVKVGQVTEVNKDTFWPLVKAAGDKAVVVDMYTQWCGPCKVMAPKFQQLSEKLLDVVFLKLDCNQENKPLAKELGIKVVPTFKILKDSKIVKEVTGAKFDDLVLAIETVRSS